MSQVVSVRVPKHFKDACAEFRNEANIEISNSEDYSDCHDFVVFYDESTQEIRCEGNFPDSVFSALVKVRDRFSGKLFYEGEEWNEKENEFVDEAGPLEKVWLILAIVFFPVTLVYLLLRAVIWVPFKIWKATR